MRATCRFLGSVGDSLNLDSDRMTAVRIAHHCPFSGTRDGSPPV
jgi:hypothetical protein